MTYFVHGADGRQYGPVDLATLLDWAREGRVIPATILTPVEGGLPLAAQDVLGPDAFSAPVPAAPGIRFCSHCGTAMGNALECPRCGGRAQAQKAKVGWLIGGLGGATALTCLSVVAGVVGIAYLLVQAFWKALAPCFGQH